MSLEEDRLLERKLSNALQSLALIGGMLALAAALGWVIAGGAGVVVLAGTGLAAMLLGGAVSPRLLMATYRARRLTPGNARQLYHFVEVLAGRAGLSAVPALYYIPSEVENAFAVGTGRDAAIGVTDGILRRFNAREIAGIIAHEISHIRNRDTTVMALADSLSRFTSLLANVGLVLLFIQLPLVLTGAYAFPWALVIILNLAPLVSALLQLALSRTREFDADLEAARLTGDPRGLASALEKLERLRGWGWERVLFPGRKRVPEPSLLRTHPPTEERVERLLELEKRRPPPPAPAVSWAWEPAEDPGGLWGRPRTVVRRPRWHLGGTWY